MASVAADAPRHPKLVHTRADLCDPGRPPRPRGRRRAVAPGRPAVAQCRDGRQIAVNIDGTDNVLAAGPAPRRARLVGRRLRRPPRQPAADRRSTTRPGPTPSAPYAWHKLEAERLCRGAASAAVVRISAVLGPHADPKVLHAARGYRHGRPRHPWRAAGAAVPRRGRRRRRPARRRRGAGHGDVEPRHRRLARRRRHRPRPPAAGSCASRWRRRSGPPRSRSASRLLPFGADRACLLDGPLALSPARGPRPISAGRQRAIGRRCSARARSPQAGRCDTSARSGSGCRPWPRSALFIRSFVARIHDASPSPIVGHGHAVVESSL